MNMNSNPTMTSVKVALRIRPMTVKESLRNETECLLSIPQSSQIVIGIPDNPSTQKSFTFDHVFNADSHQEQVYSECIEPLLQQFILGFNVTILAYGQTGSGKTYSMGTGFHENLYTQERGIVPRAIQDLFHRLHLESEKSTEYSYSVSVSFLELYNEELVDLLSKGRQTSPSIRENANGKIIWSGITQESVTCPEELFEVLRKGSLCRTTGATDMNAVSSRSHAIFTVALTQNKSTLTISKENGNPNVATKIPEEDTVGGEKRRIISKFHFVDLAGSERLKKTNAEGDRKKEGISINQGLLALGNVISALGDDSKKIGHVPYRDSKLTRMLQDSLGGNAQTLMLACVSPSDANYSESLSTLHYANRAKNIKNKISINEDFSSCNNAEIASLRSLVLQLRTELAMLRPEGSSCFEFQSIESDVLPDSRTNTSEPRFIIQRELDLTREIQRLEMELETSRIEHDKLMFSNHCLSKRNLELNAELKSALIERDSSVVESARVLFSRSSLTPSPNPSPQESFQETSDVTLGTLVETLVETSNETLEETSKETLEKTTVNSLEQIKTLLSSHISWNINYKIKLQEIQDQVGWCVDFFSRMGKSSFKTPIQQVFLPANKRLEELKRQALQQDATHERRLMMIIKENPDLTILNDFSGLEDNPSHLQLNLGLKEEESSDMYLMLHKITTDISEHEALMDRISCRDSEYEVMKKAYEQKMQSLHVQLEQSQKERDAAMKLIKDPSKNRKDVGLVSAKYEDKKRKLESMIQDYKKRLENNQRLQNENRNRNIALTNDLKSKIESMKNEKHRILKQLRKETNEKLEIATTSAREIAKWKRKGRLASDVAKKLEKSNHLQRLLLKKKNEQVLQSQHKLRNVLGLLKRTTPRKEAHRISKVSCRTLTSVVNPKLNVPSRVSNIIGSNNAKDELQYKLISKELESIIQSRQSQKVIHQLIQSCERLKGEQQELLAERSKIITMEYESTGIYDAEKPQYMDERLTVLDCELATINSKIRMAQEHLIRSGSVTDLSILDQVPGSSIPCSYLVGGTSTFSETGTGDTLWENCVNLLFSFSKTELQSVSTKLIQDLIQYKLESDDKSAQLLDKSLKLTDLQCLLDHYKTLDSLVTKNDSNNESELALIKNSTSSHPINLQSDVFERLASSHTLASQAKVIPRAISSIETLVE